jgi:predicted DNA-binding transcriptional regulator AlpA
MDKAADGDALVSLADVAEMAGVSRPAVSNWRRRNPDFPSPVQETGATSLFRLADLKQWMGRHGKRFNVRSVEQLVWSALNRTRGLVRPEEAAEAGMILLGYLTLAARLGEAELIALRAAIGGDPRTWEKHLWHLADEAWRLDLGKTIGPEIQPSQWADCGSFLGEVFDLALAFGVAEAFEALVAASARGSRVAGEHSTPSSVAGLIMSLAAPISGTILDPACGHGTLLLAASRKAGAQLTLIGQDINAAACIITRLRMLVHGLSADITHGDTLAGGTPLGGQADLVVADPPFGAYWRPERAGFEHWTFGVPPPTRADTAWLQYGISKLAPAGLAMLILPHGPLFRGGVEGEIRRRLIGAHCVRAVVALPPALYPTTGIPVALWIVGRPEKREGGGVLLVDASQLGYRQRSRTELSDADIDAITNCVRAWQARGELATCGGVRAAAVPVSTLLDGDGMLVPARWIEDPAKDPAQCLERVVVAEQDLHAAATAFGEASFSLPRLVTGGDQTAPRWAIRKISDMATLIRPRRVDPDAIGTGDTPLIRPRDLGPDMVVTPSEQVDLELLAGPVELTQPGDILVLADGTQPRAGVDHVGGAVVSGSIQMLRPRPGVIDPTVLAALITSIAPRYAVGSVVGHVDLAALEVPCPDARMSRWLRQALDVLGEQRRQALAAVQAIDGLRATLVDGLGSGALTPDADWP